MDFGALVCNSSPNHEKCGSSAEIAWVGAEGGEGWTDKWLEAISTSGRQSENANSETLHTKIDWMLDICFV